jgi:long-chain fatty acid transport protein
MKKLLFILVAVAPSLAMAQAFSTGFLGNKQHGMGNAGAGLALDATSNPAATSRFSQNSISVGAAAATSSIAYLDSSNYSLNKTNNGVGTPFYVGVVYGVNDSTSKLYKFKFLLGITTPYGANLKWEDDWTGRNVVLKKQLSSIVITPGISYKLNDKFSFAVGVGYAYSRLKVENGIPVSPDAKVNLDFKQRGWGVGAGVFYQATEDLSFGLGYVSRVNNKSYKGTAEFTVPSSLKPLFADGSVSTSAYTPDVFTLGTGYKITDKFVVAFDVNYSLWHTFDSTIFVFDTKTAAVQDSRSPNLYKDVYALRLGVQYAVTDKIKVRAGTSYEPTPVPSDLVKPDGPDGDRINITGGFSYNINDKISIDASYRFVNPKMREAVNNEDMMKGVYKSYGHVAGLSVNYLF